jgi:hypothetical protein
MPALVTPVCTTVRRPGPAAATGLELVATYLEFLWPLSPHKVMVAWQLPGDSADCAVGISRRPAPLLGHREWA